MPEVTPGRRYFAEFVGTAFLLATVIGSGIMAAALADGNDAIALLGNTIATGAILVVLITIFGPLSGAHFNPAVTIVFALRKEIAIPRAGIYILMQVCGGLLGMIVAHGMFDLEILQYSEKFRTGAPQWLAEGVATFGLLATILLTVRFRPDGVAMMVGLYITAAYWFTASTSFANPAVTVARSFTNTFSGIYPGHAPMFIVSQIAGAIFAMWMCHYLLSDQKQ